MTPPRVLLVVSADPETSHRAGEAIRIALGLAAGETDIGVVLLGAAEKILGPGVEEYVDGEAIARHIAALARLGRPFLLPAHATPDADGWNPAGVAVLPITADDLAALVAGAERTLVF